MSSRTRGAWDVLKATFRQFTGDDCPRMAAALAYYTVFSLPPLLVLLVLLAGVVLDPQEVEGWIEGRIGSAIGADSAQQIGTMVENAGEKVRQGSVMGLVLAGAGLLFGATNAFAQLQDALNKAWEVQPAPDRAGWKQLVLKRVFSLGMVLVLAFLLLVSLVLSSLVSALTGQLEGMLPGPLSEAVVWIGDVALTLGTVTLLFAAIFVVLPDAEVAWRDVWLGAFATAVLFTTGEMLLALYVGHSEPGQVYGAAAALAVLLVWVYYSAMLLLLGAELTQVLARRRGSEIRPAAHAVRVPGAHAPETPRAERDGGRGSGHG